MTDDYYYIKIKDILNEVFDPSDPLKPVVNYVLTRLDYETDFFEAPASTMYHGSERTGLIKHCLNVYNLLTNMYESVKDILNISISKENIFMAAIFHDLCKVGMYIWSTSKERYMSNPDYRAIGHGSESAKRLRSYVDDYNEENNTYLKIPDEVYEAIIFHMGTYDLSKYEEKQYDNIKRENKLAFLLYCADDLDAHS